MKTIAICNLKGGVAKTTTTVNLAADLARYHGRRVLVIDADSQCNTTAFFERDDPSTATRQEPPSGRLLACMAPAGAHPLCSAQDDKAERARGTLAELLRMPQQERTVDNCRCALLSAIVPSSFEGVHLLPADNTLMDLDLSKVEDERAFVGVLRLGLEGLRSRYDFALIDCPPAFNAASTAALLAADEVLIPIKLDAFALEGMANLMQQIVNMRRINPGLKVLGLLPVMWYKSEQIRRAEMALRESGLPILPRIRRSNRVDDMTFAQEPLCVCASKSGAAQDYKRLASWIAREPGDGDGRRGGGEHG